MGCPDALREGTEATFHFRPGPEGLRYHPAHVRLEISVGGALIATLDISAATASDSSRIAAVNSKEKRKKKAVFMNERVRFEMCCRIFEKWHLCESTVHGFAV
jgi:hypothetical protein